uniref:Uncharacterized protein n=1 Tax=Oryza nivara TaxID=4536 RepID=A0A0E0J4C7_ORYNI
MKKISASNGPVYQQQYTKTLGLNWAVHIGLLLGSPRSCASSSARWRRPGRFAGGVAIPQPATMGTRRAEVGREREGFPSSSRVACSSEFPLLRPSLCLARSADGGEGKVRSEISQVADT